MAYRDFGQFRSAFLAIPGIGKPGDDKLKLYHEWYKCALSQEEIILGRREDLRSLVKRYGYAQSGGNILLGATTWDIHVNDCWILGGVHAHAKFYLASVLSNDSVYNAADARKYEATDCTRVLYVTVREIAGLNLFGYTRSEEKTPKGQLFVCKQPQLADEATFSAYYQHVELVSLVAY